MSLFFSTWLKGISRRSSRADGGSREKRNAWFCLPLIGFDSGKSLSLLRLRHPGWPLCVASYGWQHCSDALRLVTPTSGRYTTKALPPFSETSNCVSLCMLCLITHAAPSTADRLLNTWYAAGFVSSLSSKISIVLTNRINCKMWMVFFSLSASSQQHFLAGKQLKCKCLCVWTPVIPSTLGRSCCTAPGHNAVICSAS